MQYKTFKADGVCEMNRNKRQNFFFIKNIQSIHIQGFILAERFTFVLVNLLTVESDCLLSQSFVQVDLNGIQEVRCVDIMFIQLDSIFKKKNNGITVSEKTYNFPTDTLRRKQNF
ncbi:hypothetical protein XENOCAPTIV_010353 [Xenoophorus captivus]|uniref:Uncharacterized protein n=1 Tax=Xenoophorus captivus TaxID=1517983 RepID=A0ABV0RXZ2_9TELE